MPHHLRRLARRATDRLAGPYIAELDGKIDALRQSVDALRESVDAQRQELGDSHGETAAGFRALEQRVAGVGREMVRAGEMLRRVYEEDPAQRRRLYALRASDEYELAFSEDEPLVSFIVPTYDRFESLRDVSLPSILGQTYTNLEVIVCGDCAPIETERVVAEVGDPRVRFHNRSVRGPYPEDPSQRWYMIGTPPFNDGLALARGRWIGVLGDDDAVRPDHTTTLVRAAQEHRYEHCYGRHQVHYPSGETLDLGVFPPRKGEFVLQAALYHAGLRFFQMEPADYLYEEPNDWSLCRRMLEAGVRFGMVAEFLADKHESRYHSHADWGVRGIPSVD